MSELSFNRNLSDRKKAAEGFSNRKDQLNIFFEPTEFNKKPGKRNILITDATEESKVLTFALRQDVHHIIQNSYQNLEDKIIRINSLTEDYRKYFTLNYNVLHEPELTKLIQVGPKDNRMTHLEYIFNFLGVDMVSSRAQPMVQVIEELIMNAQITAPLQKTTVIPRSIDIKIEKKADLIAISAIDYYGTLSIDKFLKKIETAFSIGMGQAINYGRGGAGLGSSIIYKYVESLFLGCITDQCTRVSVVMPFNKSEKYLMNAQKSIHIIKF